MTEKTQTTSKKTYLIPAITGISLFVLLMTIIAYLAQENAQLIHDNQILKSQLNINHKLLEQQITNGSQSSQKIARCERNYSKIKKQLKQTQERLNDSEQNALCTNTLVPDHLVEQLRQSFESQPHS